MVARSTGTTAAAVATGCSTGGAGEVITSHGSRKGSRAGCTKTSNTRMQSGSSSRPGRQTAGRKAALQVESAVCVRAHSYGYVAEATTLSWLALTRRSDM